MGNLLKTYQARVPLSERVYQALKQDFEESLLDMTAEELEQWNKKMKRIKYLHQRFTLKQTSRKK